jgi:5-methylcytosine-specific restriction endonuclease McrA
MDCGSEEHICVHHSDEDRTNNELSNLEILCRSCHAIRHDLYTNFTVKKV